MDLEEPDFTKSGNDVRRFKLVDAAGFFLRCSATTNNAKSAALQENYQVVLYFGTGRGPIGTMAGTVYLMKDASIVPIGRQILGGTPLNEIPIQVQDTF